MDQPFDAVKVTSDLKEMLNVSCSISDNRSNTTQQNKTYDNSHSLRDSGREIKTQSSGKDFTNSNKSALLPLEEPTEVSQSTHTTKSDTSSPTAARSRKKKQKGENQRMKGVGKQAANFGDKYTQEEKRKSEKLPIQSVSVGSDKDLDTNRTNPTSGKNNSYAVRDFPTSSLLHKQINLGKPDNAQYVNPQGQNKTKLQKTEMNNSDSSYSSAGKNSWDNLSRETQIKFDSNKIFFLKRKNMRFPNAKYFCRLCDYHMDSVDICEKHIEDSRHTHRKEVNDMDSALKNLPPQLENHYEAVTAAIDLVYEEHGIKETDRDIRKSIVQRLEDKIQEQIPDASLHMYGSSLSRLGLKTADININLVSSIQDKKLTTLLKDTYNLLKDRKDTGFINVHSDFSATVPALLMTDVDTSYKLNVTIHVYSALCTSEMLCIYSDFDERLVKLAVAFRHWARLCGVDKHQIGLIPPIALNIMVVFFLQTVKPQVLPIINPPEICGEDSGNFNEDKPIFQLKRNKAMAVKDSLKNKMSVGNLWVQLLKFYSIELDVPNTVVSIRSARPLPRTSKPWNSKKLAVEDPFMPKKNLTRMVSHSYDYWQYTIKKAYHYFGLPRGPDGKSYLPNYDFPDEMEHKKESSSRNLHVAENVNIENEDITHESEITNFEESSKTGDAISDIKIEGSSDVFDSSSSGHDSTEMELSLPEEETPVNSNFHNSPAPNSSVSSDSEISLTPSTTEVSSDNKTVHHSEDDKNSVGNVSSLALDCVHSIVKSAVDLVGQYKSVLPALPHAISTSSQDTEVSSIDNDLENDSPQVQEKDNSNEKPESKDKKYSPVAAKLASKKCVFEFEAKHFANKKEPTVICSSCEKEGHTKNECPDDELPEILPIPDFTPHHHKVLTETLKRMPTDVGLSDASLKQRHYFLRCLEEFVQVPFPGARLRLFGSSCNGFGFDRSDMDICMTFVKKRPNINKVYCVERLANTLKIHKDLKNVQSIPTAKVPIVKFTIKGNREGNDLDGDISLYNTLAQENTHLLYSYSVIDPRVQVLGYTIKIFAQVCDIGDASRGSLSSYAYILMMLYYLQQVKPPVIPVLQELHESKEKPMKMVEGWNAWFMDNLTKLPELWPELGKNTMSVAELWLGFLRFYVEEFNYKDLVICIRQKDPLTRFDKLWNGHSMAIEDPFDLSHNLASGLSRTMNNFILKTFINGRMLYGSPVEDNIELFNKYQSPSDYFFDTELLSEARPPNTRGCRHCGKIGHMMRHCSAYKNQREELRQKGQEQQQNNMKSGCQSQHGNARTQQMQQGEFQRKRKPEGRGQQVPMNQQQHGQHNRTPQQMHHQLQQQQPQPMMRKNNVPPRLQQQQQQQHYSRSRQQEPQQQANKPKQEKKPQSFQQQKQHEAQQILNQFQRELYRERGGNNESPQNHQPSMQGHIEVEQSHLGPFAPTSQDLPETSSKEPAAPPCNIDVGVQSSGELLETCDRAVNTTPLPNLQFLSLPLFAMTQPNFTLVTNPSLRPSVPHGLIQRPLTDLRTGPEPLMAQDPRMGPTGPRIGPDPRTGHPSRFPPSMMPPAQRGTSTASFPFYMGASPGYPPYNGTNSNNNSTDGLSHRIAAMPPQSYANMTPSHPSHHVSNPAFLPPHSTHPQSNSQMLNPVVQNLFASTQGKVLDARTMAPHMLKKN